ncbi:oxidoreductase [Ectothiorhodospira shaposhnikovii]|uniref:class I SAM-dependent methyltransferase n=1 Tax=Ectothiorhodospira shaposhnikovii TaxID=1054 RepID=UPI0019038741|nr:class I SAM-dependent methyltransferase [Ectothiorhodospira shaposhnikovii]MBK1672417.1 oxidoreductase [Ectothiorhodospira shaposhnikovii]
MNSSFHNRLSKNLRHWSKWARRRGIECFRVYDRDIPEFPVAVDVYAGMPHVQVYETRWEADDAAYGTWVDGVRETVGAVFGLSPQALAMKVRRRQKGTEQYEKTGQEGDELIVSEDGLRFSVNLHAYLDTGLFLDHRQTRAMVRERSEGKRFLNLFAYTGSFSVHAAAGGALESLTLDLSRTYQEWSLRNFQLNGLDLQRHRLERVDVMQWLEDAPRLGRRYDLIVMDPPSFSNSKKMTATLDVQRDHAWMINRCLGLLSARGELFFSNNRRGFKLYEDELSPCQVEEITRHTVPEDFGRGRPHRCWIIRRLED